MAEKGTVECILRKTGDSRELSSKDQALQASATETPPGLCLHTPTNQQPSHLMMKRKLGSLRDWWVITDRLCPLAVPCVIWKMLPSHLGNSLFFNVNVNLFRCGFAYLITLSLGVSHKYIRSFILLCIHKNQNFKKHLC